MSRFQLTLAGAAALVLLAAGGPQALAFAQSDARNGGATPTTYAIPQETVNLSPIVVQGQHMPFPIVLQVIKKSLARPWSTDSKDRDKLVCNFVQMGGSHFQRLRCQTNRSHFKQAGRTQTSILNASAEHPKGCGLTCAIEHGGLYGEIVGWTRHHWINTGAMKKLLKKLPTTNASYTLRVTDHGKPLLDYVVKDGELVKILKYPEAGQGSH